MFVASEMFAYVFHNLNMVEILHRPSGSGHWKRCSMAAINWPRRTWDGGGSSRRAYGQRETNEQSSRLASRGNERSTRAGD